MLLKNHHDIVMNLIVMLVLGLMMATFTLVFNRVPLTGALIFQNWACAFLINLFTALIFPAHIWAPKAAFALKLKPQSVPFGLSVCFVMNFIYVTGVSLGMTLLNVGFSPIFFRAWIGMYPYVLIVGFIVAYLTSLFAAKAADKLAGPMGPPPSQV